MKQQPRPLQGRNPEWTEAETAKLLELWPLSISASKIAKEVTKIAGITRSHDAIRKKGQHLGLPERMFWRRDGQVVKRRAKRAGLTTLPPLTSLSG